MVNFGPFTLSVSITVAFSVIEHGILKSKKEKKKINQVILLPKQVNKIHHYCTGHMYNILHIISRIIYFLLGFNLKIFTVPELNSCTFLRF